MLSLMDSIIEQFSSVEIEAKCTTEQSKYISKLMVWIQREKDEDVKQAERERNRGLVRRMLEITSSSTGLGGHTVVTLESEDGRELPKHSLRVGDAVKLVPQIKGLIGEKRGQEEEDDLRGMVMEIKPNEAVVGLDDTFVKLEGLLTKWTLVRDENKIVYERMASVLEAMSAISRNASCHEDWPGDSELVPLLLPASSYELNFRTINPVSYLDMNLNPSQKEAIEHCLSANHASLIFGPPGTGKTQTLVELVRQLVSRGKRVLVCGPSNTSVDNLLERISRHYEKCLRIGNPDRLKLQNLRQYLLETKIQEFPTVCSIRDRMDRIRDKIVFCTRDEDRRQLHHELSVLRRELRFEEKRAVDVILNEHQVICSTLSGTGSKILNGYSFDVLIIDEATQAVEPECWIAIAHARSVVLVGDHHQLPPVVLCQNSPLERSLFQRLLEDSPSIKKMLTTQYRMNEKIAAFSSSQLYENKLVAHDTVKDHLLYHLPQVKNQHTAHIPIVFINTAGRELRESYGTKSKSNEGEVKLVVQYFRDLLNLGLSPKEIAIISPYNAQVNLLRDELKQKYPDLEIGSVDGFQGREKEAVILSLVRSNRDRQIGFLKDYRRLNVAITRARRHLCIIGDRDTVMPISFSTKSAFLTNLGKYLDQHAEERSP